MLTIQPENDKGRVLKKGVRSVPENIEINELVPHVAAAAKRSGPNTVTVTVTSADGTTHSSWDVLPDDGVRQTEGEMEGLLVKGDEIAEDVAKVERKPRKASKKDRVREMLEAGPTTVPEIVADLEITKAAANSLVQDLRRDGATIVRERDDERKINTYKIVP